MNDFLDPYCKGSCSSSNTWHSCPKPCQDLLPENSCSNRLPSQHGFREICLWMKSLSKGMHKSASFRDRDQCTKYLTSPNKYFGPSRHLMCIYGAGNVKWLLIIDQLGRFNKWILFLIEFCPKIVQVSICEQAEKQNIPADFLLQYKRTCELQKFRKKEVAKMKE